MSPMKTDTEKMLHVARRKADCRVLGPGTRAAIWFYGCSRHCPGCIAAAMNTSGVFDSETPESLYEWVRNCQGIEGITLSGGEPFEQDREALRDFLRRVRADERELGVICFSGFTLEELRASGGGGILNCIDLLIDGPYIDRENDNTGLRGSANQRLHFLTPRYRDLQTLLLAPEARNLEISLDLDSNILIDGIPGRKFLDEFTRKMQAAGYTLFF